MNGARTALGLEELLRRFGELDSVEPTCGINVDRVSGETNGESVDVHRELIRDGRVTSYRSNGREAWHDELWNLDDHSACKRVVGAGLHGAKHGEAVDERFDGDAHMVAKVNLFRLQRVGAKRGGFKPGLTAGLHEGHGWRHVGIRLAARMRDLLY